MKVITINGAWIPAITRLVQENPERVSWTGWVGDNYSEIGTAKLTVLSRGPSIRNKYHYIAEYMMRKEIERGLTNNR